MMRIVPLLRRDSLRPGESLSSYLERLRVLNGYSAQRTIYDVCREALPPGASSDTVDTPVHAETYNALSHLCQLPSLVLYGATTHRFEECLHMPAEPRSAIDLPSGETVYVMKQSASLHHIRSGARMAFCPLCLRENPYHRTLWQPDAVTVCLDHRCLLVERCAHCRSLQTIGGLVADACVHCRRRLSDNPVTDISGDEYSLNTAAYIETWLGSDGTIVSVPGLPAMPANILYRLLDGLRWCLLDRVNEVDRAYLNVPSRSAFTLIASKAILSIAENHILFSTAMKGLLDWPHGFHEFLHAYNTRRGVLRDTTLQAGFGLLYETWLHQRWQPSAFDFVRDAFNAYLVSGEVLVPSAVKSNHHRVALLESWDYLTVKDAMRQLGIAERTFKTLTDNGTLHEVFPHGHRPFRYRLVSRREVDTLRRSWDKGLSLDEAAAYLGLSKAITADLARAGKLEYLRKPQEGSAGWLFDLAQLDDYLARLYAQVGLLMDVPEAENEWLNLHRASQVLGPVGYNTLTILEGVMAGTLPTFAAQNAPRAAGSLLFAVGDIDGAIDARKAENGWYSAADIAALLHLKRTVIDKWIAHGLLIPAARSGLAVYFDRATVDAFIAGHVFSEEAAQIMGISTVTVQKWVRGGRLKAISGPDIDGCHRWLFARAEVERFRPQNRLTAPQMAKLMGIGAPQFMVWIRQGKVKPVSGPGVDEMGQYLFLKDQR